MKTNYIVLEQKSGKNIGVKFTAELNNKDFGNAAKKFEIDDKLYFVQIVNDKLILTSNKSRKTTNNYKRKDSTKTTMIDQRLTSEGWAIDQQIMDRNLVCNVDPRYLAQRLSLHTPIENKECNTFLEIKGDWRNHTIKFGDEPSTFVDKDEVINGEMEFYSGLFYERMNRLYYAGCAIHWGFTVKSLSNIDKEGYYTHNIEIINPELIIDNASIEEKFKAASTMWTQFIKRILSDPNMINNNEAKNTNLYTISFQ